MSWDVALVKQGGDPDHRDDQLRWLGDRGFLLIVERDETHHA